MTARAPRWRAAAEATAGAALSCALLALYARVEQPWVALAPLVLVPWLWSLERAPSRRGALLRGLLLTVGFCLAVLGWFPQVLQGYTQAPAWACWGAFLLCTPLLQPQFLVAALVRQQVRPRGAAALAGGLAYVATEWAFPKLFADTLGHGLYASEWLRQGADVAGAPGLTLALWLANEAVLAAAQAARARQPQRAARALAGLAALLVAGLGYGALRLSQVEAAQAARGAEANAGTSVGMVQANLTRYGALAERLGTYEAVRLILDTHYALSDALLREGRPELLVWPETVYPTTFGRPRSEEGAELDAEVAGFVTARGVPLLFGAYDAEGEAEFNAAMLLTPAGEGRAHPSAYRKAHLFPLTEWVPQLLRTPWVRQVAPWLGTWTEGRSQPVLSLTLPGGRRLRVAPLICYDALFPAQVRSAAREGAELILTLSNDAWFSGTPAPRLHLVLAAFRSIETRLPQVRTTNSGISALIGPTGALLATTPTDARAALTVRAPPPPGLSTLVLRWGEWLGPLALVGTLLLLVLTRRELPRVPRV